MNKVTMRYGSKGERAAKSAAGAANLLSGTSWTDEYLDYAAKPIAATTNGEKLTDYIDISGTSRLLFISTETEHTSTSAVPVLGVCYYDADQAAVSPTRQTFSVYYIVGERKFCVQEIQVPDACIYLRIWFRTFGDSAARASMIDVNAMNYSTP